MQGLQTKNIMQVPLVPTPAVIFPTDNGGGKLEFFWRAILMDDKTSNYEELVNILQNTNFGSV